MHMREGTSKGVQEDKMVVDDEINPRIVYGNDSTKVLI